MHTLIFCDAYKKDNFVSRGMEKGNVQVRASVELLGELGLEINFGVLELKFHWSRIKL